MRAVMAQLTFYNLKNARTVSIWFFFMGTAMSLDTARRHLPLSMLK